MAERTRVAQVGLGLRSWLYSAAIVGRFGGRCELVGVCDSNAGRLAQRVEWARAQGLDVAGFAAADFDRMLRETRPDRVVVTSPDWTHDLYVAGALERGCDVVCEKPLAIDAARIGRILDAQRVSGSRCVVAFNYRYAPPRTQVKQLLAEGAIGAVRSVELHWLLDTRHGADYFRRWHRRKANSGGLLVHKATHHFDLVNWWLDDLPVRVFASGRRSFYGPERAAQYGIEAPGERCLGCAASARCPFHLDLRQGWLEAFYRAHEHHDGYFRDRCVFSPEIDIEDGLAATVEYRGGARLAYSLEAASPWEGYTVAFNGTRGRLEHRCRESTYVSGDGTLPGELLPDETATTLFPHFGRPVDIEVASAAGPHGGGDERLVQDLFAPESGDDPFGRRADQRAGAWSALVGIAGNRSIATGAPVALRDLVPGLA
jgi:predicted dehydrogenase